MNTPKKVKILLVEDDKNMAFLVEQNLQIFGYEPVVCHDGESALKLFRQKEFDLCVLDIMLPKMDGFTLATVIRKENEKIPIIFLTARNMIQDIMEGYRIGGDDYLIKPFHVNELIARIKAVLKRTYQPGNESVEEKSLGLYHFNYLLRELSIQGRKKKLSAKEADLLNIFIDHKNQLLARQVILRQIWGEDNFFNAKSMDVYLSRLRKLLVEDPGIYIMNVHGTGYRMIVKDET